MVLSLGSRRDIVGYLYRSAIGCRVHEQCNVQIRGLPSSVSEAYISYQMFYPEILDLSGPARKGEGSMCTVIGTIILLYDLSDFTIHALSCPAIFKLESLLHETSSLLISAGTPTAVH